MKWFMPAPVFFSVGQDIYRIRFPGLLEGFNDATIEEDPDGRFGSDLLPARIETWFMAGDKPADIPPALRDSIVRLNGEASRGRTLLYINGRGI